MKKTMKNRIALGIALSCLVQIWPPSNYSLAADLKRMLQGKKFGSNEEVITKVESYFESKNKSFYEKNIKE